MKRLIRKATIGIFAILVLLGYQVTPKAAIQVPEKVKIGIYYSDSKTGIKKAVSSFIVSADKGVQFGFTTDGTFNLIYEEQGNNGIIVKKDTAFYTQVGTVFDDIVSANSYAASLKQKDVNAFVVYKDGWEVWTGPYVDQATANADIDNTLQKKLENGVYTVVQPSQSRIAIIGSSGVTEAVFDSITSTLQVYPKKDNAPYMLMVDGKGYRGDLEVRRLAGSDMTVINILPLEEYLYGVVPGEIEASAHIEAVKAQAVAARTYTINNLGKYSRLGFDLCDTVYSQVYKGFSVENPNSNRAVDETKAKKVVYNGRPAQVFYFSSSGGRTEDVKNVWGSDIPYLRSVEDKYESGKSWKYNWETTLSSAKIKEIMASKGKDIGNILSVNITKRADSGRAIEVVIRGTKSQAVYTNASTRDVFKLDSQWYDISTNCQVYIGTVGSSTAKTQLGQLSVATGSGVKTVASSSSVTVLGANGSKKTVPSEPTEYKFTGKGWGHAVGMSQEGAKGMANAGYKYDQILKHYFQGTIVE